MTKTRRRTVYLSALLAVLLVFTVCLSACNKPATDGDIEYGVYIRRTLYNASEKTMTIFVSLSLDDRMMIEGAKVNWHFEKRKHNAFFNRYDYTVSFSPKAISSVVKDSLTQEQLIVNDIEYNTFKFVFEYATIYKSLETDGKWLYTDGMYLHDFPLDETSDEFETTMSIKTQNAATWYGVLIAVAVAVLGVIICIVLVRRKKYATEERTENN